MKAPLVRAVRNRPSAFFQFVIPIALIHPVFLNPSGEAVVAHPVPAEAAAVAGTKADNNNFLLNAKSADSILRFFLCIFR
jgi:hypothetical protein